MAGARYVDDFDKLPIPFRAVATDMMAGEMVVLGEGDLTVAMRASMAVPGAFSPVIMGDRVLADGGQMRNVPVDIARKLCGDVIIAVSLESPPPKAEDLTSALALVGRSVDVMIDANSQGAAGHAHGQGREHRRAHGRHRLGELRSRAGRHSARPRRPPWRRRPVSPVIR